MSLYLWVSFYWGPKCHTIVLDHATNPGLSLGWYAVYLEEEPMEDKVGDLQAIIGQAYLKSLRDSLMVMYMHFVYLLLSSASLGRPHIRR